MPVRNKKTQFFAQRVRLSYLVALVSSLILSPTMIKPAISAVFDLFLRVRTLEARMDGFDREMDRRQRTAANP